MPAARAWSDVELELATRHEGRYLYKSETFVNMATPMIMVCPDHGVFKQSPKKHRLGNKCVACRGLDAQMFIERACALHGDTYEYEEVVYKHSNHPVRIRCKEHGVFMQVPRTHLSNKGCPKCGVLRRRKDPSDFVQEVRDIHGDVYDLTNTVYTTCRAKVQVLCRAHGIFFIRPDHLTGGLGCPVCAHVSRCLNNHANINAQASVYLARVCYATRSCVKVGYTTRTTEARFSYAPPSVHIVPLAEYKSRLRKVIGYEKQLLTAFKGKRARWMNRCFSGFTECFDVDEKAALDMFETITRFGESTGPT